MRIFLPSFIAVNLGLAAQPAPDFNRDIRPILSDKCYRCHGPDDENRKGGQNGLRLDTLAGARADLGGGAFAVVPGDPAKSELIARITTKDDEDVMPPRKTGKTVTPAELDLLKRWIAGGAAYARHWSYEPPRRPAVPAVRDTRWARNPVDAFILSRLEKEKLAPQAEADRAALARRVALDLTGLPPTARPAPTSASSIGSSPSRPTASTGRASGSTSRATPIPRATPTTSPAASGATAIT